MSSIMWRFGPEPDQHFIRSCLKRRWLSAPQKSRLNTPGYDSSVSQHRNLSNDTAGEGKVHKGAYAAVDSNTGPQARNRVWGQNPSPKPSTSYSPEPANYDAYTEKGLKVASQMILRWGTIPGGQARTASKAQADWPGSTASLLVTQAWLGWEGTSHTFPQPWAAVFWNLEAPRFNTPTRGFPELAASRKQDDA